jgi:NADH-quinone oxidoreductase subunit J
MGIVSIVTFWFAAAVALGASLLAVSRRSPVHGLLWLILSLLAVAVLFFMLGAPFAAALEVVLYAGAIMVLFLFVVMMLNLGKATDETEASWLPLGVWITPGVLALGLGACLIAVVWGGEPYWAGSAMVGPQAVGAALYGPYVIGVELASMLLLAGLVAAYHLGHRTKRAPRGDDG